MKPGPKNILSRGCVGYTAVAIAGLLFLSFCWSVLTGIYFNTPLDRAKLRLMVAPLREVPQAIEAHRTAHGAYPSTIDALDSDLPLSARARATFRQHPAFRYGSDGERYTIHRKLNWDGGVSFTNTSKRWFFVMNEDVHWPIDP